MAIKTFTTGEVLTASDTNTYLANSGTQYVSSGTFAGVGSFDVTGFSSTYDAYELVVMASGNNSTVTAQIYSGATVRNTLYYGGSFYIDFSGASGNQNSANGSINFPFCICNTTIPTINKATISGIGTNKFGIVYQHFQGQNSRAVFGGFSCYAAANSFDMIRCTGTTNLTGSYSLTGFRKS